MEKAGLLHDIGKLEVPRYILDSTTEITPEQRQEIDDHVRHGCHIVNLHDPLLARIIAGSHEHQPRPYPRKVIRLDDDPNIIKYQRLLALADQTDSLLSKRSYKEAWSPKRTHDYLLTIFNNPQLINSAINAYKRIA